VSATGPETPASLCPISERQGDLISTDHAAAAEDRRGSALIRWLAAVTSLSSAPLGRRVAEENHECLTSPELSVCSAEARALPFAKIRTPAVERRRRAVVANMACSRVRDRVANRTKAGRRAEQRHVW
jgi:hypothetical protein